MKRVLLHAGTHKTGTKSIQSFLNENRELLRSRGIYVPEAGRRSLGDEGATPGHHVLPVEIRSGGSDMVHALLDELARNDARNVIISSEEFAAFHKRGDLLAPLFSGLRSQGYEITVALYVREQAGYAAAIYSEIAKYPQLRPPRPSAFVDEIVQHGGLREETEFPVTLEYSRMMAGFARLVGDNIVMRAFNARAEPDELLRDFVSVMSFLEMFDRNIQLRSSFPRANQRMLFGHMLGNLHKAAISNGLPAVNPVELLPRLNIDPADPIFKMPASFITRDERVAILDRFRADNEIVERVAGISIPQARSEEVTSENALEWVVPARQRAIFDQVYNAWFS